jgi:AraC-like DNA-binding protein
LGLSPAGYARLVRFQRAAMAISEGESLGQAAVGHAFNDQAHMSRAFRQLSGLTPGQIVRLSAAPQRAAQRRALAGRVALLDAP